jgi:hypothetical protein
LEKKSAMTASVSSRRFVVGMPTGSLTLLAIPALSPWCPVSDPGADPQCTVRPTHGSSAPSRSIESSNAAFATSCAAFKVTNPAFPPPMPHSLPLSNCPGAKHLTPSQPHLLHSRCRMRHCFPPVNCPAVCYLPVTQSRMGR